MQILIFILSALAFVMAGVALILVIQDRNHGREFASSVDLRFRAMSKANKESKAAMLKYVDESCKQVAAASEKLQKETRETVDKSQKETTSRLEKISGALRAVHSKTALAHKQAKENAQRIEDLEHGVIPDYETARKAADEFNKFNEGIAGILGFDPLEAMKSRREDE